MHAEEVQNHHVIFYTYTNRHRLVSLRSWPHMVAVLKLRNCDILKWSLAQTLQFWLLVTTISVWCRDPQGSPMKNCHWNLLCKVYGNKSDDSAFFVHACDTFIPPLWCMCGRICFSASFCITPNLIILLPNSISCKFKLSTKSVRNH